MTKEMTEKQKALFIWVAQMGVACGLYHPYEWYANYELHFSQLVPYSEAESSLSEIQEAFCAFFRNSFSCPEDSYENWTVDDMIKDINDFYSRRQNGKK